MTAELRPDVVLMDLSMPGVDGVRATAGVLAESPDTHVLVLTSYSDQRWILDALKAGADGYLLKHAEARGDTVGHSRGDDGGIAARPQRRRVHL